MRAAYAVYRRALYDYRFRLGLVDEATAKDPPIDVAWPRESAWVEHLWATAAENWVAVDADEAVVGWALSTERDGVLELTHLFVQPGTQSRGIGRSLIKQAFPPGRGRHRVILATQDAPALGLYLRSGVGFQTSSLNFIVTPRHLPASSDLKFERLAADETSLELVAAVEQEVIGHRRDADTRLLLGMRPAWVAIREGRVVGFAFGAQLKVAGVQEPRVASGPMAAIDVADMPAILDHVVNEAALAGVEALNVGTPLVNRVAVEHLMTQGHRIDPFFIMVLTDTPTMQLERWIHTGPFFIL